MVSVPARGLQLLLAVTAQATVALPEPLVGVQVSQPGALLDAVQLQPFPAVTVTVPLPAPAVTFTLGAEIEYVQGIGAPACITTNDWPAMSNMPLRPLVLVLASTLNVAVPPPLPLLLVRIQL